MARVVFSGEKLTVMKIYGIVKLKPKTIGEMSR